MRRGPDLVVSWPDVVAQPEEPTEIDITLELEREVIKLDAVSCRVPSVRYTQEDPIAARRCSTAFGPARSPSIASGSSPVIVNSGDSTVVPSWSKSVMCVSLAKPPVHSVSARNSNNLLLGPSETDPIRSPSASVSSPLISVMFVLYNTTVVPSIILSPHSSSVTTTRQIAS